MGVKLINYSLLCNREQLINFTPIRSELYTKYII
jgi:hypothetical protein